MLKEQQKRTNYMGSKENFESVKKQIEERFGPDVASDYNPNYNCMSYNQWARNGYSVNKNQRGFTSKVIVEKKDRDGKVIAKYPRTITLFYETQVSKL
jgi:hypothetical protein